MVTVYFSKEDYREDMRRPYAAHRAHAVCRRLTATASQDSQWYAAHYWAACLLLSDFPSEHDQRFYTNELTAGCYGNRPRSTDFCNRLWDLAIRRVESILQEARDLKTSVLW